MKKIYRRHTLPPRSTVISGQPYREPYRTVNMYSDLKLRMGPSESSCRSSRAPKFCGRASEVWSGAQSARLTLGTRAHGGRLEAGFRWYERAGERPVRTQAVGLKEWWAGLQLAERASELTAAGRRAGLPNELHPKFESVEPMAVPNPSSDPSEV
jgi:hypothetical protein